eukprot:CAMPEP_0184859340 /NCGR_PEP_ID=MMETSP0580-20130426/4348_1 /TAXON_ID=1118495 /ORGANISM="Dactyliosolen fragilissimus" /LENGTH=225 /DNA_ID=CAMNT_0027355929 /DNA_START=17 /DNA_END=695 /DNA_ORIENTATION=-
MISISTVSKFILLCLLYTVSTADETISWSRRSYDDISLSVGDSLTFNYGFHNVILTDESGFNSCSGGNVVGGMNAGPYTATFGDAGTYYYYCGVSGHCPPQRVKVIVSAGSPTSSSPSSSPSGSPSGPPSSVPSSSPIVSKSPVDECRLVALNKFTNAGNKLSCIKFQRKNGTMKEKLCKKPKIYSKCAPVCEGDCSCKDDGDTEFERYIGSKTKKLNALSYLET